MVQALANWILSLARNTSDKNGAVGLLKIYEDRTKVRGVNSIAFARLQEHCGVSRDLLVTAIGSLLPTAGTGSSIHVVVTTPERKDSDKRQNRLKVLENRDKQTANRFMFLSAADAVVTWNLPTFVPPADETTVN